MASRSASESFGGTSNPVSPSITASATPPASKPMTGTPLAAAFSVTTPETLGKRGMHEQVEAAHVSVEVVPKTGELHILAQAGGRSLFPELVVQRAFSEQHQPEAPAGARQFRSGLASRYLWPLRAIS